MRKIFTACCVLGLIFVNVGMVKGEDVMVEEGKTVSIDYMLTVNGEVVDSSEGKDPLEYIQGKSIIIPGLENALNGLQVGDKKNVIVAAAEAYGEKDDRAVIEVPKSNFNSEEGSSQAGMMVQVPTQSGQSMTGVVVEVKEEALTVDFNHPLAGKELTFDVEIMEVK